MDEEGIGLVLARATELRLNITNCIHRATSNGAMQRQEEGVKEAEEEGEEMEKLLNICDALEALESQLSSLQAMQQNLKYERESALVEIEKSRKALLDKLSEYKGKDLEVIQEATVFASETVEEGNDLLLPPYPTRPPLSLENGFPSNSNPTLKSSLRNGAYNLTKKNQPDHEKSPGGGGLGHVMASVARTVVTLVGVVAILGFAGFGNKTKGKHFSPFGAVNSILRPLSRGGESGGPCPPGKVLVVEDGQARCLVKERIEVPFESSVSTPYVNYGCG
ncbi:plastid division protein PDV2 [Punica granatum]|uniref:Uncharacterized protein n=2 Tax=Punica granatum TaxID=22663 RepID=A0A218XGG4_PUNGR|nr:plastid division protein PDV2 [Punica granatum]OWM83779.1 hypothetical protein CDL15_Pgr004210 [Punica granatum]PKI47515.1 hypothetical protein CRG98_032105 [Punica granatum]